MRDEVAEAPCEKRGAELCGVPPFAMGERASAQTILAADLCAAGI